MPDINYNAFGLIDKKDLLDYSQGLAIQRPRIGSILFPDRKTEYLDAEYERMMKNGTLPMMAQVHAYDTEAHIAERLTWEKVQIEKLFIKEKINQTEILNEQKRQLNDSDMKNLVFDDAGNLCEMVLARVEKAKIDALTLGKYPIEENNLKFEIDYGIPQENFVKTWWDEDANIPTDIVKWSDQADEEGMTPNVILTTRKVFRKIQANKAIQIAIKGAANVGVLPTIQEINNFLEAQAEVQIALCDEKYGVPQYDGTKVTMKSERFFPADTVVMTYVDNPSIDARGRLVGGTIGEGLWGPTPEERALRGTYQFETERQFVTLDQWGDPDPVAVWTKASGLMIPVLPNVYGHIIANIADDSSKPEAVLTGVKLPLSVENGGTGAATADNARTNLDVYSKSEVDGKVAG